MDDLSIKVTIAGRTYPLTIAREDEEGIRKAVNKINDNIQQLQESYAVKDKQDLLAMTALEYATEVVNNPAQKLNQKFLNELSALQKELEELG